MAQNLVEAETAESSTSEGPLPSPASPKTVLRCVSGWGALSTEPDAPTPCGCPSNYIGRFGQVSKRAIGDPRMGFGYYLEIIPRSKGHFAFFFEVGLWELKRFGAS